MQPPLLEVILELQFDPIPYSEERLQYFHKMNGNLLPDMEKGEAPDIIEFLSADRSLSILVGPDDVELRSTRGVSVPHLRSDWTTILDSFWDIFAISAVSHISLSYLNEIPMEDLNNFQNYLNISFEMPAPLTERIEFFRSEFTYKYDFGEIKVWLQPDWDEQRECYCIQLNLESRHAGSVGKENLFSKLQELHEGIKDVFHQILSQSYINQLPQ